MWNSPQQRAEQHLLSVFPPRKRSALAGRRCSRDSPTASKGFSLSWLSATSRLLPCKLAKRQSRYQAPLKFFSPRWGQAEYPPASSRRCAMTRRGGVRRANPSTAQTLGGSHGSRSPRMFNFSANHLLLLSRTEYRSCVGFVMSVMSRDLFRLPSHIRTACTGLGDIGRAGRSCAFSPRVEPPGLERHSLGAGLCGGPPGRRPDPTGYSARLHSQGILSRP